MISREIEKSHYFQSLFAFLKKIKSFGPTIMVVSPGNMFKITFDFIEKILNWDK
jgi:hypothetical protein